MRKKTHKIDNPCICTAGGIIREGGYYFYKEKDQPAKCLIIVEKVLQNDCQKLALLIYFPQPDRRIEINHLKIEPNGECKWLIFDGLTSEEMDKAELNTG